MMKKLFLPAIITLIVFQNIFAQNPGARWLSVLVLDDQSVYLDSSNIKHVENQVTAVSLTQYKKPVLITAYNKYVKSIKSQILFNLSSRKFTTLGTLLYDEKLKIVGESSLPGFSLGNESFATSIDSNKTMYALYEKCIELLKIDTTLIVKEEKSPDDILPLLDRSLDSGRTAESKQVGEPVKKNEQIDGNKFVEKTERDRNNSLIDSKPKSAVPIKAEKTQQQTSTEYNSSSEKNPQGTIFTDGTKFCFQVSSWKNKTKAENEVARLKSKGHNAFIAEVNLPNKGGMWYRVRIGYFNSLDETESYMKKMK